MKIDQAVMQFRLELAKQKLNVNNFNLLSNHEKE